MKRKIALFLSKIAAFCKSYVELCLWLLVFAVGIRIFEVILLNREGYSLGSNILWNLTGLGYDISLYLRTGVWILIIFVVACFLSEKTTRLILRIFLSLMLLLSLICVLFFATSGYLLDKAVFSFSLKEMWAIILSSSKSPVWVYIVVIALPMLYFYLSGKRIKVNNILLIIFAALTLSSFFIFNKLPLYTEQYHVKVNKECFFLKSIVQKQVASNEDIAQAIKEFRRYFPEHRFAETEYPFLYQAKHKDVLSPFFNLKPEPPNLVFVIVEGLGAEFVNPVVMPFLDSLSQESLTWEYCLSVASRTFGVLPALFGAAPLGEKGFLDQCPNNPEHHTLLRILHQNNYTHHFFYGGRWQNFDQMEYFAEENNMTSFKENDWEQDIKNQCVGSTWGYEDHLMYKQALRKLNQQTASPRVDVYLTLSTHDPWVYPRKEHFENTLLHRLKQARTLSEQQKKNINASFVYADWSIRELIDGYQKREDFNNTIFIITGDHHVGARQFGGFFNYHVPLIIYSPMLESGRSMKGVVSHRDITPTILSLLKNNFHIETPSEVTWLNTALDTSLTFKAHTFSPIQTIDRSISGMLYKNYMLCEGILEELTDGALRRIDNPEVLQEMNRLLSLYKALDSYALRNDALIRNPYAHKKLTDIMIHIEDTISSESYFAKKSNLQVVEGPEGRKNTLYFDSSHRFPVGFIYFDIPDNIETFSVEVEFKIYIINDDSDKNCYLVTDLSEVTYKANSIKIDNHNKWYTYKNSFNYKKERWESLEKTPYFKMYLFNNEKVEGFISDIKVKVSTI